MLSVDYNFKIMRSKLVYYLVLINILPLISSLF